MWYVLAAANALSGDSDLIAGTQLRVPEVGVSKNDANTFKPYNPNEIVGSTSPSLPYIPPAKSNTCAIVAMAIVAIVVTIYTAGAAVSALAPLFGVSGSVFAGTTATLGISALTGGLTGFAGLGMAAAAVGGLVGSIAAQVVGKALGAVDNFSWRQAVGAGIAGGLTAGISSFLGPMSSLIEMGQWGRVAASAALTATGSYVGNEVAGVKGNAFSWKSIAASAVTAVVAGKINKTLGTVYDKFNGVNAILGQTVGGMVSNAVSVNVRSAFGIHERTDWKAMTADAFGNAVGNAIVSEISSGGKSKSSINSTTYDILDEAGYDYSLDKSGNLQSGSLSAVRTIDALVKSGYSNQDLIEFASDSNIHNFFERADISNEHINESSELRNTLHVHGDNGMIVFPLVDESMPEYSIQGGMITGSFPESIVEPDNFIVNTVNNVITPIAYAAADLHEFAQAHPNSAKALEISVAAASIALWGPLNFVKDKVIDGLVGPYFAQGNQVLSQFYNSKGVNDVSSPLAATGTIFAGLFLAGSIGSALGQAKVAARQAHMIDVARREQMINQKFGLDSESGINDIQIFSELGLGARLGNVGARLKITSPLVHKNGAGKDLPVIEALNFEHASSSRLSKGTKIYRIIDNSDKTNGAYWAFDLPKSKEDWRADYAVRAPWNKGVSYVEYTVPKGGLDVWVGPASSQSAPGIPGYILPGGATQIYVPNSRSVIPKSTLKMNTLNW